jgi:hypothetical protein
MHTIARVPGVHRVEGAVRPPPHIGLSRAIRDLRAPDSDREEVEGDVLTCAEVVLRHGHEGIWPARRSIIRELPALGIDLALMPSTGGVATGSSEGHSKPPCCHIGELILRRAARRQRLALGGLPRAHILAHHKLARAQRPQNTKAGVLEHRLGAAPEE